MISYFAFAFFCAVASIHAVDVDITKPRFWKKAETARWLAHQNLWGSLATISVHLKGAPFSQPKSFVDGPEANSTGVIYFWDSDMDTSMQDIAADQRVSFSLTAAAQNLCPVKVTDPESPVCARAVFSGKYVKLTDPEEMEFAKNALYERHPTMPGWPHDFYAVSSFIHCTMATCMITNHPLKYIPCTLPSPVDTKWKIELSEIWLIDVYGGASYIDISDYYAVDGQSMNKRTSL
jgi:hypothetical protein